MSVRDVRRALSRVEEMERLKSLMETEMERVMKNPLHWARACPTTYDANLKPEDPEGDWARYIAKVMAPGHIVTPIKYNDQWHFNFEGRR